jgi:hypothetical protein
MDVHRRDGRCGSLSTRDGRHSEESKERNDR